MDAKKAKSGGGGTDTKGQAGEGRGGKGRVGEAAGKALTRESRVRPRRKYSYRVQVPLRLLLFVVSCTLAPFPKNEKKMETYTRFMSYLLVSEYEFIFSFLSCCVPAPGMMYR